MRKTITIPAAGEILAVPITGRSLIIEEMGVYPTIEDVPTFDFNPGVNDYPMYPRSVYPNSETYNQIIVHGTAESAGDEITLLSTDQCLTLELNIIFSGSYEEVAGITFEQATGDTEDNLTEAQLLNAAGKAPKKIIVSALDAPVKYAFNAVPNQNDFGHVLIQSDTTASSEREIQLLEIEGLANMLSFTFKNANNGSDAMLTITPIY